MEQVAVALTLERLKKEVQKSMLFWLLSQGRPMTDYEFGFVLCMKLNVSDCPTRHWSDSAG